MIRSTVSDGWLWLADEPDDRSLLCPSCSPDSKAPDAEPVPLGGNMVPDSLVCIACGCEAENPS